MAEWFSSGLIIDAILVLVVLEAAALLWWNRRTGRGPAPLPLLCNLASGAALMLAVRASLTDSGWPIVAACLFGSLLAHVGELAIRLRRTSRRETQPQPEPQLRDVGTPAKIVAFPLRRQG